MVIIPPVYTGRDPVNFREMIALYERFCNREMDLSPVTVKACLMIQRQVIDSGSLRFEMAQLPRVIH